MAITLDTRKPIDKIGIDDINVYPIWEFDDSEENDESDETYIRPVNSKFIPLGKYSMSVAAIFKTASGMEIKGIVGISTDDGIEIDCAGLIFNGKYIFIPPSDFWNAEDEYIEIASQLGMPLNDVFPLQFTLLVPIEGEDKPIEGLFAI